MRRNAHIERLLDDARHNQRCAYGSTRNERAAFNNRARHGDLLCVFSNCFTTAEYWASLNPDQRTMHLCRTLHESHPSMVFAGVTAATILRLPLSLRLQDGSITCAATSRTWTTGRLHHLRTDSHTCTQVRGLPTTNVVRTVVDCGLTLPFEEALPMYDAAVDNGAPLPEILRICQSLRRPTEPVLRLLHYTDGRSENGGESWARAVMISLGFAVPELQVQFYDAQNATWYRVDYLWRLPNGTLIVGEFDGMAKYFDETMGGGRTMEQRVQRERRRNDALLRAGVSRIVHFSYNDVLHRVPLQRKLEEAGVPYAVHR